MTKPSDQSADVLVRPGARLLSKGEMLDKVGVTYPTVWKLIREGAFPRAVVIGGGKNAWLEHEVDEFIANLPGHSYSDWPLVVLKELLDNALDAAEEAEVAPVISVAVDHSSITIQDNAGGIAADTITSILDYTIRVSSREAYVSPTRGAQG